MDTPSILPPELYVPHPSAFVTNLNPFLACDTVQTGLGWTERIVGRVSVVDGRGELLLDRFVAPTRPVTDHLTDMTGIRHTPSSATTKLDVFFLFKLATLWIYSIP